MRVLQFGHFMGVSLWSLGEDGYDGYSNLALVDRHDDPELALVEVAAAAEEPTVWAVVGRDRSVRGTDGLPHVGVSSGPFLHPFSGMAGESKAIRVGCRPGGSQRLGGGHLDHNDSTCGKRKPRGLPGQSGGNAGSKPHPLDSNQGPGG